MNKVWIIFMTVSTAALLFINPKATLAGMIAAGNEATALSLKLLAVYAIWLGILKIVEETGLSKKIEKLLRPLIRLIFGKEISEETTKYISINMTANLLGVGGAATPMGIKAIESMGGNETAVATMPMIMLTVINASGIQILPTTIIGMRQAAKSASASNIILPCIIATFASAIVGIILVRIIHRLFSKSKKAAKNG